MFSQFLISMISRKTPVAVFVSALFAVFFATSLFASPLVIKAIPGTRAVFAPASAPTESVALGVVPEDGLLIVSEAPAHAGTLVFSHPDAEAAESLAFEPGKTPEKLTPALKLRAATLIVSALPADEVEIFVNGEHRGRGAVTLGGVAPREKITIEARSARRGMQSRVVSAEPGETLPVRFDLRGNEAAARPDGQIVLPELPLVLASQAGATLKADGAVVVLEEGVLRGLEPGERVVEIFLPWRGREVCVWRGALPARSAMLPGADVVAIPNPVPAKSVPEAETPAAHVLFVIGSTATVSLGSDSGLREGATVSVVFGDSETPVSAVASGVTPKQSQLRLPEGVPAPKEGDACRLAAAPAAR